MGGEIIEDYPDDFPHPSCLVFGYAVNNKIIHVVVSMDKENIGPHAGHDRPLCLLRRPTDAERGEGLFYELQIKYYLCGKEALK